MDLVEASVASAISDSDKEAQRNREKAIQWSVADRIEKTVDPGDNSPALDREDAGGAPKRAADPMMAMQQPASVAPQQAAPSTIIDADAIIDKFNIIRSGRSLNDRDIRDLMKRYLGSLAPQQLQAVFAILQRIGQIVQPAVQARMHAPPEEPSAVTNARLQMLQKKHDKQQVTAPSSVPAPKAVSPQPLPAAPADEDEEDNSPPIRVGGTSETVKRRMKLSLNE
jgi:hypothetical protein